MSVETSRYTWRVDDLRRTAAAVRFVSAEPLLGPLRLPLGADGDLLPGHGRHPLGDRRRREAGPGHRRVDPDWCCAACATSGVGAGIAFHFKQWGGFRPTSNGRLLDGREWSERPAAPQEGGTA